MTLVDEVKCLREGCKSPVVGYRINRFGVKCYLCQADYDFVEMCHVDDEQKMFKLGMSLLKIMPETTWDDILTWVIYDEQDDDWVYHSDSIQECAAWVEGKSIYHIVHKAHVAHKLHCMKAARENELASWVYASDVTQPGLYFMTRRENPTPTIVEIRNSPMNSPLHLKPLPLKIARFGVSSLSPIGKSPEEYRPLFRKVAYFPNSPVSK